MNNIKYFQYIILICLLCFALFSQGVSANKQRKPVEVTIKSFDEFQLVGKLDIPDYASIQTKAPLVIFLHSINKSSISWEDLPEEVKNSLNVATLTLDLRGHGKSIKNKYNRTRYWQNIFEGDFKSMPDDIMEVLKFIEHDYPEIDNKKIAIVGASLGASVGTMTASYKPENIRCLALLSPMVKYKGFDLRLPIVKYGEQPALLLVSAKDKYSYDSSIELMKFFQGKKKLETYPFGGHGEDLLKFQPNSKKLIVQWLKDNFYNGKIPVYVAPLEEQFKKFKSKTVGEYDGKVKDNVRDNAKNNGDIHGSLH
ncbi:MAG: alpha/beta hydrolase [Candidatus Gastranaerophilales bacterium]|nr:alpha/beta hydrolase [Candidatus Gastranaerophilales bacterium]